MRIINGILDRVFDGHSTCIPVNQLDEIGSSHSVFQSRNEFETKPLQKNIIQPQAKTLSAPNQSVS